MLKIQSLLAVFRLTGAASAAEAASEGFFFRPVNFVENLNYMGIGMLAIFIVIGVIVGITYLLNLLFKDRNG